MSSIQLAFTILALVSAIVFSSPTYDPQPLDSLLARRQSSNSSSTAAPEVDLGYERYQGVANASLGLNIFRG